MRFIKMNVLTVLTEYTVDKSYHIISHLFPRQNVLSLNIRIPKVEPCTFTDVSENTFDLATNHAVTSSVSFDAGIPP